MVTSFNRIAAGYYEPNDDMGQLLTLMVFGDMVASDADNMQQPQRQPQQGTAGRSTTVTRYRVAQHSDDDEVELECDIKSSIYHVYGHGTYEP